MEWNVIEEDKVKVISNGVRDHKSEYGSFVKNVSKELKSKVPRIILMGGGDQGSNRGGHAQRGVGGMRGEQTEMFGGTGKTDHAGKDSTAVHLLRKKQT